MHKKIMTFQLEPINEYKQTDPYDIYEVPIPSDRLKSKMILRRKMPLNRPTENYSQHNGTHRNMEPVKARQ